jgi:hypothetical protein
MNAKDAISFEPGHGVSISPQSPDFASSSSSSWLHATQTHV